MQRLVNMELAQGGGLTLILETFAFFFLADTKEKMPEISNLSVFALRSRSEKISPPRDEWR